MSERRSGEPIPRSAAARRSTPSSRPHELRAGLSRFSQDADTTLPVWTLPATEVLLVLEGEARIDIEGGPQLNLKEGDMACLPKGAVTTWHLTLPFKELWVLAG